MPRWINRATKQLTERASPSTMRDRHGGIFIDENGKAVSNSTHIFNPNTVAVDGFASRYWLTNAFPDDSVSLAGQSARDAIDAAILAAQVAAEKLAAKSGFAASRQLKAFAELLVTELNQHSDRTNAILDAIDGAANLSSLKVTIGSIGNLPTRDFDQLKTAINNNVDAGAN